MKATNGSGKGDTPRPVNKVKYDAEYTRLFGEQCGICRGKGYHWDENKITGKMIKTTCIICSGSGKVLR